MLEPRLEEEPRAVRAACLSGRRAPLARAGRPAASTVASYASVRPTLAPCSRDRPSSGQRETRDLRARTRRSNPVLRKRVDRRARLASAASPTVSTVASCASVPPTLASCSRDRPSIERKRAEATDGRRLDEGRARARCSKIVCRKILVRARDVVSQMTSAIARAAPRRLRESVSKRASRRPHGADLR